MVKISDFPGNSCAGYMRFNLFPERNIYLAKRGAWPYSYSVDSPGTDKFVGKSSYV